MSRTPTQRLKGALDIIEQRERANLNSELDAWGGTLLRALSEIEPTAVSNDRPRSLKPIGRLLLGKLLTGICDAELFDRAVERRVDQTVRDFLVVAPPGVTP